MVLPGCFNNCSRYFLSTYSSPKSPESPFLVSELGLDLLILLEEVPIADLLPPLKLLRADLLPVLLPLLRSILFSTALEILLSPPRKGSSEGGTTNGELVLPAK